MRLATLCLFFLAVRARKLNKITVFLAVRAQYEGGMGGNKKHEINKVRCLFFWAVRARKQKNMRLYEDATRHSLLLRPTTKT